MRILMPIGPAKMPLMEHFAELRRRLVRVIVVLLVATIALYFWTPQMVQFLINPILQYLPGADATQLNVLNPLGGFTLRFKVAFVAAVMITAPVWIWNFLAFFLPALKPNERKWFLPTFFVGMALFIVGNVFCYFIILDPAFGWLLQQTAEFANILPDAYEYVNLILMFELSFGIAFELPLVVFYLVAFRIVSYKKLRHAWRVVYIVLMIVCAAVTPDASPVTMLLLFAAMVSLYEISLALARMVLRKRIARDAEELGLDESEKQAQLQQLGASERGVKFRRNKKGGSEAMSEGARKDKSKGKGKGVDEGAGTRSDASDFAAVGSGSNSKKSEKK